MGMMIHRKSINEWNTSLVGSNRDRRALLIKTHTYDGPEKRERSRDKMGNSHLPYPSR